MRDDTGALLVVDDEQFLREAVATWMSSLGFAVMSAGTEVAAQVPVIFLTAKDTREDKVAGLTMGGDDYITKPLHLDELAARVRTVLRRTRPIPDDPVLTFADITLDQDKYEVSRGGDLIELSPTEFRLLRYFMLNPGRVLTQAQLLANVWNQELVGSNKVVATYVVYLRRKLAGTRPELIHTQRGVGYCLRLPRPDDDGGT
jgi:two-component system OmpR family response regulator